MPDAYAGDLKIAGLAALAAAAFCAAGVLLSPPGDEAFPPASSYSHAGDGGAAAYETLRRLGYQVRRNADPLTSLGAPPASTVLVLADPAEPPSAQDRRALDAFIAAGGHVFVSGCLGAAFLVNTPKPAALSAQAPRTFASVEQSPLTEGAPAIEVEQACGSIPPAADYRPLYGDAHLVVAGAKRRGDGLAVWVAASTPFANGTITRASNVEMLVNVAGGGERAIVWDEYYHGQRRSLWSYAAPTPLPWIAAQVALAGLVAAAMFVRRCLPARPRWTPSRTSPLEFVDTMAGLYGQAGDASVAAGVARSRLKRALAALCGVAPSETDERLAAAAATRVAADAKALADSLREADRLAGDRSAPASEVLRVVRQLQELGANTHATVHRRPGA